MLANDPCFSDRLIFILKVHEPTQWQKTEARLSMRETTIVRYFFEFRLYPGNENSHGGETFDNGNGVADSIDQIGW